MTDMNLDTYVCTLTKASAKKAKKELNEDPKERLGAVAALREWIKREPWIESPTDTVFLLAFLRCGKFSQLKARERLTNFITGFITAFPGLIGSDPGDDKAIDIIRKSQSYVILPGTDDEGKRLVIIQMGKIDVSGAHYNCDDWSNAIWTLLLSLLLFDENVQVNGITFLMDVEGISMGLMTFLGIDTMRRQSHASNKAMPLRIKGMHYINMSSAFHTIFAVFKPMLTKKLQDRIVLHGHNMTSVYKTIDMSLLPDEYLPDDFTGPTAGSLESCIERNITELLLEPKKRMFMKDLLSGRCRMDKQQRDTLNETQASFRKLNVS